MEPEANKFNIEESINEWDLFNGTFNNYEKLNQYTPISVFTKLNTTNNPFYTPDNKPIQNTFDYVLFLFSMSMAKNWRGNWISINNAEEVNLKRRNGMIVSFLSIFTAYFKPILDAYINTPAQLGEYTQIIRFINKIIYLHNSILDGHNQINGTYHRELTGTTYDYNKLAANTESNSRNLQNVKELGVDKSYEILDEYNADLIRKTEFNPDREIPGYDPTGLTTVNLTSSNADKKTEILLPQLPSAAAWEPILSKKKGLAGVEINKVLDEINLGMCKSTIGLTSSATQFKVTGIPFTNISFIRNNLFLYDDGYEKNESHFKTTQNIDITKYFEAILQAHYDGIQKFRILTAIDNHYDKIYFTKVGSFDLHITADTYKKVITDCKTGSRFKFITGIHAYDKKPGFLKFFENVAKLQAAHRVMLIFDIPVDNTPPKIYYYEPFGQYFPVYDMYGRLIPDMQERVIGARLAEMYAEMNINPKPQIVVPYIDDTAAKKYCNSGIFNLSRATYFGHGDIYNNSINSVINSTDLHNDKTLDWISGYCGLIIIFMMVMVKINCDMQDGNPRKKTIDDIFIWFNEFNTDPFNTYDNLMSRFILRGFGRVVENILEGKQLNIQPVVYDLADINISNKFRVDSQGKLISKLGANLKKPTKQDLTRTLFNLIGINETTALVPNDTIRKKLNSVIQFMYRRIRYSDEVTIELDNSTNTALETDEVLDEKLSDLSSKMAEHKRTRKNPDETLDVVPVRLGSIFGSWISKYNIFRNKGNVGILPLAANNAMTATATGSIINPTPTIHRVLFIDTNPPTAALT